MTSNVPKLPERTTNSRRTGQPTVLIGVTVARNGQINHAPTAEALGAEHVAITPEVKEND